MDQPWTQLSGQWEPARRGNRYRDNDMQRDVSSMGRATQILAYSPTSTRLNLPIPIRVKDMKVPETKGSNEFVAHSATSMPSILNAVASPAQNVLTNLTGNPSRLDSAVLYGQVQIIGSHKRHAPLQPRSHYQTAVTNSPTQPPQLEDEQRTRAFVPPQMRRSPDRYYSEPRRVAGARHLVCTA